MALSTGKIHFSSHYIGSVDWELNSCFNVLYCSGSYGEDVSLDKLKDFHRRRIQVLVEASPDLLAFETIPNKLEAQACVELLEEENVQIPAWICFTSVDGENAPSGESFEECLETLNKSNNICAVGINCAPPQFMDNLIRKFSKASKSFKQSIALYFLVLTIYVMSYLQLTKKAIVVYPNSGEVWDGKAKKWLVCSLSHLFVVFKITLTKE